MDFHLQQQILAHYYTSVFYYHIVYLKPVGSWRIYIIMVIGAHDSMITIQNGGQCHTCIWRYSCSTARSSPDPIRK